MRVAGSERRRWHAALHLRLGTLRPPPRRMQLGPADRKRAERVIVEALLVLQRPREHRLPRPRMPLPLPPQLLRWLLGPLMSTS